MNLLDKVKIDFRIWLKYGLSGLNPRLKSHFISVKERIGYQKWIRNFDTLTPRARETLQSSIENFGRKPLISVLLPVYDIEEKWLRLAIGSVKNQIYQEWELCIADDCSPRPHLRRILEDYAKNDDRIKVVFRPENGHISAASNSALELATGEFSVLLDHDDKLAPAALFYIASEINDFPDAGLIYSDEDLIDEKARRFGPKFKPDWSPDHFYSSNITTHLSAFRTDLLRRIGGFRIGYEGSQDYDLALRVIEQIDESQIRHIPRILYHWRVIRGSVARSSDAKPYAHDTARKAIGEHLERLGKKAKVVPAIHSLHRVRYELPPNLPKVTVLRFASDDPGLTVDAARELAEKTDYSNLEIAVICSESQMRKFEDEMDGTLLLKSAPSEDGDDGAAAYNRAVSETNGDILCFLGGNLRPTSQDWLKELVSFAVQPEIGAVGAKILGQNDTVVAGGLLIGVGRAAAIAHYGCPRERDGYLTRNRIINNYSAVSVSCLVTRRNLFAETGGFDSVNFPNKYYGVDYCLKLRSQNLRVVWTPYAELHQIDPSKPLTPGPPGSTAETSRFRAKWKAYMEHDPSFNPNLSKKNGSFLIKTH